ncbi:pyrroline-5-carboxylate reductase [Candidatus Micrarchaeota archaeon]|nr:pyrroline-5-carboxylate reductase [Candidatus Micrarchaeota archaeon]MBU2477073.1 pyrroline-5-carboxylate reductase [Candidatus Micrarchaeota archaeon]
MIALIGCGEMGTKILKKLLEKNIFDQKEIIAADIKKERLDYIKEKFKVNVSAENKEAAEKADTILMAVRPQEMKKVLEEISSTITKNKIIISVAAGVKLNFYEKFFPETPVFRVMPNPFTESSSGVIAYCRNRHCDKSSIKKVEKTFRPLCEKLIEIKEEQMNVFTVIASCSSAHFYWLFDVLTAFGEENGFSKEKAKEIVLGSAEAAAKEAGKTGKELKEMIKEACTPKGLTIEGINHLKEKQAEKTVRKALEKTIKRAEEIEKELIDAIMP